jgi:hypothetical protein
VSATVMREKDQRMGSGMGCGIAYRHLTLRCVAWRGEEAVPCGVMRIDGTDTDGELTTGKRIVDVH